MTTEDRLFGECADRGVLKHARGNVLDAGCGDAEYTWRLAELPTVLNVVACDIVGPDDPLRNKRLVRKNLRRAHANFYQEPIESLSFAEGAFDTVWCWRVLQYVASPSAALASLAGVCKVGGVVILRVACGPDGEAPERVDTPTPEGHPRAVHPEAYTWRNFLSVEDWIVLAAGMKLLVEQWYIDLGGSVVIVLVRSL